MKARLLAPALFVFLGCRPSEGDPAVDAAIPHDGAPADASDGPPADSAHDTTEGGADATLAGWQTLPPLPVPRLEVGVAALRGQVYVVGGTIGPGDMAWSTAVHAFDPGTSRWLEKRSLPAPGLSHANLAVVGDRLFLLGPNIKGQVFEYDPDGDLWIERRANLRQLTDRGASGIGVIGGKIYVAVGGFGSRLFALYDPAADAWQALPTLATPRDHVAGAAIGNTLYVIGGSDRSTNRATDLVQAYDVTAAVWVDKRPMPTARSGCAAVVMGGEIVVIGGEGDPGSGQVFSVVEAYNPVSDSWRTLPPMKSARHGIGAAAIDGKIYVPGGSTVMDYGPGGETFEVFLP
jgi:N-acetylneuraminic acid mutarotase